MKMFQCIAESAFFVVEIIFLAGGAKESSAEFEWSVHESEWTIRYYILLSRALQVKPFNLDYMHKYTSYLLNHSIVRLYIMLQSPKPAPQHALKATPQSSSSIQSKAVINNQNTSSPSISAPSPLQFVQQ